MASNIRTFSEQFDDPKMMDQLQGAIKQADRIVFLGFSFQRQNMELMAIPASKRRQVFGSAYGIPVTAENELATRIRYMLGVGSDPVHTSIHLAFGHSCKETLSDFSYELTGYI